MDCCGQRRIGTGLPGHQFDGTRLTQPQAALPRSTISSPPRGRRRLAINKLQLSFLYRDERWVPWAKTALHPSSQEFKAADLIVNVKGMQLTYKAVAGEGTADRRLAWVTSGPWRFKVANECCSLFVCCLLRHAALCFLGKVFMWP